MRQQVNRKTQLCHVVIVDHLGESGIRDPGGLESEGLTLRSGSILRGRTPHPSQMSDSQALTEFDMVTVQGQAGLSPSESETVTSYTISAAAADLSYYINALTDESNLATSRANINGRCTA